MKKNMITTLVLVFILCIASTAFAGPFSDVPPSHWSYDAVNQLAKAGIVTGYGDGTFRGERTLTRYEMAIVVGKAMEHADKADAANKALISKLATEYAQELKTLGVRVDTLEDKVKTLEKVQINGDFRLQNRTIDNKINSPDGYKRNSWNQFRIRLNVTDKVDEHTTLFTRFSTRNDFGVQDTATSAYGDNSVMDQYGMIINNGSWIYKLGRQDVKLGQGGIIGIGKDAPAIESKFDGAVVTYQNGDTSYHFIAGKTNGDHWGKAVGFDYLGPAEWYGLDASTKLTSNLTMGLAFAHEKYNGDANRFNMPGNLGYAADGYLPGRNYTAINASYNLSPETNFYAEYIKSNASTQNTAYNLGFYFTLSKGYVGVQYNNVKPNGVDPYLSAIGDQYFMYWGNGFEQGYKSYELYYGYPISKNATFNLVYNYITSPVYSGSDNELATSVSWSF